MTKLVETIAIAVLSIVGCKSSESETPVQGIQSIIQLYEARDFNSLIRTRYAEISKAENEEQIQSLIDRFTTRFKTRIN
ncbi:MAG: hypothetical protein KAR43_09750 [Deltaproteobacteria bacterium]|nr:hypothetical protein [Deltaproteobacteria bacterium]